MMNSMSVVRSERQLLCKQQQFIYTSPCSSAPRMLKVDGAFTSTLRRWRPLRESQRTRRSFSSSVSSKTVIVSMAKEAERRLSRYQVFLSFRGPDTRQGFTDTLFQYLRDAGVRVFRDNNELHVGGKIGENLMQAIHDSQIYIPIFSKTYAESKWCLWELAQMVEATRNSKDKKIIPIFYDVTTDDVKCKNGLYDMAISTLDDQDPEDVMQWKKALKGVCNFKGWEVRDQGYGEFCKSIVREILIKLRVKHKQVPDHLVGMDDQVKALMDLLDMDSDGVHTVGIYGMGGIGKTTLAKVVFNQLYSSFDAYSFISDVREKSDSKGLVYLQKQLIKDLGGNVEIDDDEDDGLNNIMSVSCSKKVLIVLDDISKKYQIEKLGCATNWFGVGSRIIITTRDKGNLGKKVKHFVKEELDDVQALELFSLHAFGEDTPPEEYIPLSEQVVSFTGRLPLSLEIIGSLLNGIRGKKLWKQKIEELKVVPPHDVQKRLRISYEFLDNREKEIFLDIACFFIGEETKNPIYMWDACGFFPKTKLDVLTDLSLIKIINDKFWMHDQVKDLGREIVREEKLDYPYQCTRIWEEKEAYRILKCLKKSRENIKAIRLPGELEEGYTLTREDLGGLENLRFLELPSCVQISEDLRDSLPNLKWLRLQYSPSSLSIGSLVILELKASNVQFKGMENLKVLDLSESMSLRKTPDLSSCNGLEVLVLTRCENLIEIDRSIGDLKALRFLDARECKSLKGLPKEIGSLQELEKLVVGGSGQDFILSESFRNLKSLRSLGLYNLRISDLPVFIGDLESLEQFRLWGAGIRELPDSIGRLANLQCLSLRWCSQLASLPDSIQNLKSLVELHLHGAEVLKELPDAIGGLINLNQLKLSRCNELASLPDSIQNLKSLIKLDLKFTKLTALPDIIGGLVSLQFLYLQGSELASLPDSIVNLKSLVELNVQKTKVMELPDSLGDLKLLKVLNVSWCPIEKLPSSIGKLKHLEELHASYTRLQEVPMEIGRLPCLRMLDLESTRIRTLPSSISHLSHLKVLWLDNCDELQQLPQLPSSLQHLRISPKSFNQLPDLSNCTNLTYLQFKGRQQESSNMDLTHRYSKLELSSLQKYKLTPFSSGTTHLELDSPNLPYIPKVIGLIFLTLDQSSLCSELVDLSCTELTTLVITDFRSLESLANFPKLPGLQKVKITSRDKFSYSDLLSQTEWESLNVLKIECWNSFDRLPDISKVANLEGLYIRQCSTLKEIEGLGELTSLKILSIQYCYNLETLPDISKLVNLEELRLCWCFKLKEVEGLVELTSLVTLTIVGCKSLQGLPDLSKFKWLKNITIHTN